MRDMVKRWRDCVLWFVEVMAGELVFYVVDGLP